jgi:uncharacterized protein YjiS (DUF1127 family)
MRLHICQVSLAPGFLTRWLGAKFKTRYGAIVAQMRRRRAIRELHALDDRALADIGIGRGDITNVVRFGRPPAAQR